MNSPDFDSGDPHSNGAPGSQNRKRKAPGASGRGVASLTPEQLAKKRANDREAQRAIRERTKSTIDALNDRIRQLESQHPYQELQTIIRQRNAVQEQHDELKRRLASVMTIIQQPLMGAQDLASMAQQTLQPDLGQSTSVFPEQYVNGGPPRSVPNQPVQIYLTASDHGNYPSSFHGSDTDHTENASWANPRTALSNQRETMHKSHELSENGERLNFGFLVDHMPSVKNGSVPSLPDRRNSPNDRTSYNNYVPSNASSQASNMLPKNCEPTCPLDHILLNFLRARQQENASYASGSGQVTAYQSPAYPSISNLLNPSDTAGAPSPSLSRNMPQSHGQTGSTIPPSSRNADPLSTLMTDIISKFPSISGIPEQVATIFTMFIFMRWQIHPTQENYDRLPDWARPRTFQIFTPHPAWVDHLVWPSVRERLVQNYQNYHFSDWFLPFTSGLSVNWPYEPVNCLIGTGEHEDPVINPVFEQHIRRLENWSVGPQFVAAFPELADCINVRDGGNDGINHSLGEDQVTEGLASIARASDMSMHSGPLQSGQSGRERSDGGS